MPDHMPWPGILALGMATMAIEFTCDCGRKFRAKDDSSGREFRCPKCGIASIVPETNVFEPADNPLPNTDIDHGVDLVKLGQIPLPPIRAIPKLPGIPFWKNPVILIGGVFPAVVLAWFAGYLLAERMARERAEHYRAIKIEADRLFAINPEMAIGKYEELLGILEGRTRDAEEATVVDIARRCRDQLREVVGPIVAKRRADAERAEMLANASRAARAESERLARFSARVSGGAWIEKRGGTVDMLRGATIYVIRSELPKAKLAHLIDILRSNPRIGPVAEKSFRDLPPDHPVDLKVIWAQIRVAQGALEGGEGGRKYSTLTQDLIWDSVAGLAIVARADTNIDGKYTIEEIKGGKYYMYVKYYNEFSFVEWIVDLKVERSGSISRDFHNNNAAIIQNKMDSNR